VLGAATRRPARGPTRRDTARAGLRAGRSAVPKRLGRARRAGWRRSQAEVGPNQFGRDSLRLLFSFLFCFLAERTTNGCVCVCVYNCASPCPSAAFSNQPGLGGRAGAGAVFQPKRIRVRPSHSRETMVFFLLHKFDDFGKRGCTSVGLRGSNIVKAGKAHTIPFSQPTSGGSLRGYSRDEKATVLEDDGSRDFG
jgi:hypothetical protein